MIAEDYVSSETAKLLKEKGFKKWCDKCYGTAVCHKGVPISFDEECDLKDEGLGDEIEYIEGGCLYNLGCNNSEEETNLWAAPTLWVAMEWLRDIHNLVIQIELIDFLEHGEVWLYSIIERKTIKALTGRDEDFTEHSYEEACESAIRYCLEHLI